MSTHRSPRGMRDVGDSGRPTQRGPSQAEERPPYLALSRGHAAAALDMSLRHFQRHVQPHVSCVYSGQLRLFPVAELERWLEEQSWRANEET